MNTKPVEVTDIIQIRILWSPLTDYLFFPQQFLYFLPLPQGQGALRPILVLVTGVFWWADDRSFFSWYRPIVWASRTNACSLNGSSKTCISRFASLISETIFCELLGHWMAEHLKESRNSYHENRYIGKTNRLIRYGNQQYCSPL